MPTLAAPKRQILRSETFAGPETNGSLLSLVPQLVICGIDKSLRPSCGSFTWVGLRLCKASPTEAPSPRLLSRLYQTSLCA